QTGQIETRYILSIQVKRRWCICNMSKLLTAQEVADLLRVHKKTIHRMIHSGKLDASKVANKFLIKEEDAKGLLENKNKMDN
ncbi:helix-turn-helix domain-containing protein, partial [Bacillus cereus]|uniref:helix-turn-helix domain-containing protein n=2 Tax=Bacillus TaxID=1386 RepID=UPI003D651808